MDTIEVIGVRFKKSGKIYYFHPNEMQLQQGEKVIVETARGIEFGTVMKENMRVNEDEVVQPLKNVIRTATQDDEKQNTKNKDEEKIAFEICLEKIKKHTLDMKLIDVEITFDRSKMIFYFTSDGRVDFRELVKDLASVFRTRIELRQIGVRDEAKMINSIGICGRCLCCASFLDEFHPVSIKMAKEQNLSLNPTKISGICGRLMCCLKYEEDVYCELNKTMPKIGDVVQTIDGKGEVIEVNLLKQMVKVSVVVQEGDVPTLEYYPANEIKMVRSKKKCKSNCSQCPNQAQGDKKNAAQ